MSALVDRVNKVVPDIGNLIETVKQDQEQLKEKGKDVGNQIEELKKKVVQARDLANRYEDDFLKYLLLLDHFYFLG